MKEYDPEEEPIYSIEDQDEPDPELPEDEEGEEEPERKPSPISVLMKIMFSPVEGWKAMKRARFSVEEVSSRCFYPLIALAAVSDVCKMFYEANVTFSDWAVDGLTTFITFFFGYFSVLLLGGLILPKKSREVLRNDVGKQYVMMNMSTLAIFWVLIQLMPMIEPALVFLPLWTIYLVIKGVRILRVPDDVKNSTAGYFCLLIIGLPLLWNWLFSDIILSSAL